MTTDTAGAAQDSSQGDAELNAKATSEGGHANSSLITDNAMQEHNSIIRRVHILACAILGLDDSDHEDDEEAKPIEDAIMELVRAECRRARIDEVESWLDAQDQETDLDGRPTAPPYHIISGDGERYLMEQRITELRAELEAGSGEGGKS